MDFEKERKCLYIIQDAIEPLKYEAENEGKENFYSDDENISLTCDRGWIIGSSWKHS